MSYLMISMNDYKSLLLPSAGTHPALASSVSAGVCASLQMNDSCCWQQKHGKQFCLVLLVAVLFWIAYVHDQVPQHSPIMGRQQVMNLSTASAGCPDSCKRSDAVHSYS